MTSLPSSVNIPGPSWNSELASPVTISTLSSVKSSSLRSPKNKLYVGFSGLMNWPFIFLDYSPDEVNKNLFPSPLFVLIA